MHTNFSVKKLAIIKVAVKKSPYSELFWSAFFPHFSAFGLNTERYGEIRRDAPYRSVFSPNGGKCGKNADQNDSEYGHSLRSDIPYRQYKTGVTFSIGVT